jgi:hypothetical protein
MKLNNITLLRPWIWCHFCNTKFTHLHCLKQLLTSCLLAHDIIFFTKYHAIASFDVTKLKREFALKLQLLATYYWSSYRKEIQSAPWFVDHVAMVIGALIILPLSCFLILKYEAHKYFSKIFNHHIDMTAYNNFIPLSTNFPDSPRILSYWNMLTVKLFRNWIQTWLLSVL